MVAPKQIFKGFSTLDENLSTIYDIELVKRDLVNHMFTRKRSRVMNPTFGFIVWDLLFEPFNESMRDRIIDDVKQIVNLEPRVSLTSPPVVEETGDGQSIVVIINITYHPFDITEPLQLTFDRSLANNF